MQCIDKLTVALRSLALPIDASLLPAPNQKKESVHASVKGGMKYNTGRLLMVLHKPLIPQRGEEYDRAYGEEPEMGEGGMIPMP